MTRTPDLFGASAAKPDRGAPYSEPYLCRICRAPSASLSDDMGRTWFCRADAPAGFFPKARAK